MNNNDTVSINVYLDISQEPIQTLKSRILNVGNSKSEVDIWGSPYPVPNSNFTQSTTTDWEVNLEISLK